MKRRTIIIFLSIVFGVLILKLLNIQVFNSSYRREAEQNALRQEVLYPPRGEVYDRNGEFLVRSIASYDLMMTPKDVKEFDTVALATLAGVTPERLIREIRRAENYSRRIPSPVVKQMTLESKLLFDEGHFPGFHTIFRTMRSYPRKIAGNLLGYISEVSDRQIAEDQYYKAGDYAGISGIELAYEPYLRGKKGVEIKEVDVNGVMRGAYKDGLHNVAPASGEAIVASLSAELQALGEELMQGKVGSIIAIEPSTGEILVMVSSPSYDPDELVGRERGNNYMKLLANERKPLFNRAVMSRYPPGSTFKIINGLIGLQEGVLVPSKQYPCYEGYTVGRGVKCHVHTSPLNLQQAVQMSCNAYFCFVFRSILDNPIYGGVKNGFNVWEEYVRSFGFGSSLESDFVGELTGYVPNAAFYDKSYRGRWNSLTVISLAIGQGELGCTPLQMANLAATVANRGFYYPPHVVQEIVGRDSLDKRFYERHYTKVEPRHFDTFVDGMYDAVHKDGGTARIAYVEGLDICGKTGTAQNPHGADHSTFISFAPKDNPRIAISVYVENGGFGASTAAPIASLIIEKYLTGKISRPALYEAMKNKHIHYHNYDKAK